MNTQNEKVEQVSNEWQRALFGDPGTEREQNVVDACAKFHVQALEAKEAEFQQAKLGIGLLETAVCNYEATSKAKDAEIALLREQCRVGDVAFQHLFCTSKGMPLPEWVTSGLPNLYKLLAELSALRKELEKSKTDYNILKGAYQGCAFSENNLRTQLSNLVEAATLLHEHAMETCRVFFEQDNKPIDVVTDLGEAYQDSEMWDKVYGALQSSKTLLAKGRQ